MADNRSEIPVVQLLDAAKVRDESRVKAALKQCDDKFIEAIIHGHTNCIALILDRYGNEIPAVKQILELPTASQISSTDTFNSFGAAFHRAAKNGEVGCMRQMLCRYSNKIPVKWGTAV